MEYEGLKGSTQVTAKALKEKGVIEAEFSVFGNLDSDGDIVNPGAFKSAFESDPNPAVVWTHLWQLPPIGETLEAKETDTGAYGKGRLFLDDHEVARQVYAGVKSGAIKGWSYHYRIAEGGAEKGYSKEHDREVRFLNQFAKVAEWGPTLMGANDQARTLGVKSPLLRELMGDSKAEGELEELFALIESEGEEPTEEGKAKILEYAAKLGARNNRSDKERLQAIHDYSVANGATCSSGKEEEKEEPNGPTDAELLRLTRSRALSLTDDEMPLAVALPESDPLHSGG